MNQDAWATATAPGGLHCWVLADGLGGHAGGEVASTLCVESVAGAFERGPLLSAEALRRYLEMAQQAILERQRTSDGLSEMRSTVVALVAAGDAAVAAHVGDSRLYHVRAGRIIAQTLDHSVPQVLVAAGDLRPDEIRQHADRNRLLRVVGHPGDLQPTIDPAPRTLLAGDAFLLCSDGFWELVHETEMEADFAKAGHPDEWLASMRVRVEHRLRSNSDNYSVVGIFAEAP